ncbi:MAG: DMT family transporter [Deltaproteobacteria bacterium]|nr:DMT family transporter [Deltaproteobacteria bacterium]
MEFGSERIPRSVLRKDSVVKFGMSCMKTSPSQALKGALWMISSAVFFSLMSLLVRIASQVQGINTWITTEFRFLIGIAVVLAISAWKHDPLRFVNRRWLISRGLFGGAAVSIYFYSIAEIGIAKAAIFTYSYPLWAGLLAPLLFRERINLGVWAAIVAAFGGLYLIIVPPEGLGSTSWMDLLGLSSGLLTGWAILSIKKLHETDTSRAIFFSQCFFGLIIVVIPAQSGGYSFPAMGWITLLAVGLLAAVAQLQMTYAYKFIGATEGSLLSMLTPVLNVVLGLFFLHEPVTTRSLIGCIIVLASCAYASVPQQNPQSGGGG